MGEQSKKTVYCISGLGADERIFSRLNIRCAELVYLQWLIPTKEESIAAYATRMCGQIDGGRVQVGRKDPGKGGAEPVILMGVSFGGMMAIEMAKQIPGAEVILISSIKTRKELPLFTKLFGVLGSYRLISATAKPAKNAFIRTIRNHFLGTESKEEARLSNEFSENVDPVYLRWAIKQVTEWKNAWQPQVLYRIHGSRDRTFPLKSLAGTHIVKDGGHFMVLNRAKEVSGILADLLCRVRSSPGF